MKIRFKRREDPEITKARAEYLDFARWAGATTEQAERLLTAAAAGRELTDAIITHAGDVLAERTGRGLPL